MNAIKTKIRCLVYRLKHDFFTPDNIILATALFFGIVFIVSTISATSRNWELAERLKQEKVNLAKLELEVETIELENSYYASTEYQELAARRLGNKKLPGETMIYLPENSYEAKTKHQVIKTETVEEKTNFEKWLSFLFGI